MRWAGRQITRGALYRAPDRLSEKGLSSVVGKTMTCALVGIAMNAVLVVVAWTAGFIPASGLRGPARSRC